MASDLVSSIEVEKRFPKLKLYCNLLQHAIPETFFTGAKILGDMRKEKPDLGLVAYRKSQGR